MEIQKFEDYGLEENENKDQFLKRIDQFSSQEALNWLNNDWKLDTYDVSGLIKNFNKKFDEYANKFWITDKWWEEIWKIYEKYKGILKKDQWFENDFFELWKLISWLKEDLVKKSEQQQLPQS